MGVEAASRQQFVVRARFHDDAVLKDENGVRLPDRRQSVRDHDGGFLPRQSAQSFKDQFFRIANMSAPKSEEMKRVSHCGGCFEPMT